MTDAQRIFQAGAERRLRLAEFSALPEPGVSQKNNPQAVARCLLALGNLYRSQGQWEEAEACYHDAESYTRREDLRCHILHAWALLDEARGQGDAARTKWQSILPTCRLWKLRLVEEVTAALERLDAGQQPAISFAPKASTQGFAIYLFGSLEFLYVTIQAIKNLM